jgi:hypothetical protein
MLHVQWARKNAAHKQPTRHEKRGATMTKVDNTRATYMFLLQQKSTKHIKKEY